MSASVLLLESFYGGSHRQLMDLLEKEVEGSVLHVQSDKKWHWRARTGALYFSQRLPHFQAPIKFIFTSSVFNLAEFVALRPDLREAKKILYFHENQLQYPVRKSQERDFQYGYNQVLSCLVADQVLFNSHYNMTSFLDSLKKFFKGMPDYRPPDLKSQLLPKCQVLSFPIEWPLHTEAPPTSDLSFNPHVLKIVWPHRWEHDKNPTLFLSALKDLSNMQLDFHVYILGQQYEGCREAHKEALSSLGEHIKHWGFLPCKDHYHQALRSCDVAVSTAQHEFFGVSMLEASYSGCYPLCPNNLVYPELYPERCLYKGQSDLVVRLAEFCKLPSLARSSKPQMDFDKYSWNALKRSYLDLFREE